MSFISYAQNFEDVMLWRALQQVDNGFYIDVGAWSALKDSVTRAFYERGWRGINIEPNPPYYKDLVEHRTRDINLRMAVGDVAGRITMYFVPESGLSSLDEKIIHEHERIGWPAVADEVDVTTLASLWEAFVPAGQDVHFLKVDVEGWEEAVLRGNDWAHNRPWIVVVEATKPMSQVESYASWGPILTAADYRFVYADGLNRFYVASERDHLVEAFRYPPNEFDQIVRLREVESEARVAAAESAREQFELRLRAAEAETTSAQRARSTIEAQLQVVESQARAALDARIELESRLKAAEFEVALVQKYKHQAEEMEEMGKKLVWLDDCVRAIAASSTTPAKIEQAESDINYAMKRTFVERLLFRPDGRPVKPLRRLLFHTSGKPRGFFRRIVFHKNGRPRKAFSPWLTQSQRYVAKPEHQHDDKSPLLGSADGKTPRERYFLKRLLENNTNHLR